MLRLLWIRLKTVKVLTGLVSVCVCGVGGGLSVGGKESFNLTQDVVNLVVA